MIVPKNIGFILVISLVDSKHGMLASAAADGNVSQCRWRWNLSASSVDERVIWPCFRI